MATRPGSAKRSTAAARGRQTPEKRKFPLIPVLIGGAIAAVMIIFALVSIFGSPGGLTGEVDATSPGGPVPTMETRSHVDGAVQYNTNPPTSGDHNASPATWGIYPTRPPTDERLVHNLEHGGVIISYDPAKVDESTVETLGRLVEDMRTPDRMCIILTPRPQGIEDGKPIALTSWGVLATLDSFDEGAIRAFWRDHVARGPELGEGVCG
jgi:hypothetical protein